MLGEKHTKENLNEQPELKNKILTVYENTDQVPFCLRTLMRAQMLIHLNRIAPTNVNHLNSIGFKKSSVRKILREFVTNDLVTERFFMYQTTEKGRKIIQQLKKDPLIVTWLSRLSWYQDNMGRPKIIHSS